MVKYGPQTGSDWQWFSDAGEVSKAGRTSCGRGIDDLAWPYSIVMSSPTCASGNGKQSPTSADVMGNNPLDANTPSNSTRQRAWVQHLVSTWGTDAAG